MHCFVFAVLGSLVGEEPEYLLHCRNFEGSWQLTDMSAQDSSSQDGGLEQQGSNVGPCMVEHVLSVEVGRHGVHVISNYGEY